MNIRENFYNKLQQIREEAEQQLDELHGKSKEAMKMIKKRVEKKHDEKWEETQEKRKKNKSSGPADTRGEDKERNDLAKRWLRADRAEKKLEEGKDSSYAKYLKRMKGKAGNSYKDEGNWSKEMKPEQEKAMRKKDK